MSEIPEPWATAMVARGFTDRRTKVPRPSARALADDAGLHATTVLAMTAGVASDPRSVQAVAKSLGLHPEIVSGWIDPTRLVRDPWVPPSEADLLTRRQRDALTELIRAMATTKESESDGDTPTTMRAAVSAAVMASDSEVVVPRAEEPTQPERPRPARKRRDG